MRATIVGALAYAGAMAGAMALGLDPLALAFGGVALCIAGAAMLTLGGES